MQLTKGQEEALQMAKQLVESPGQIGILRGYAGTGKTTIIRQIAEEIGPPLLLAPTGKAALRVKEATGQGASTIHMWRYYAKEKLDKDGKPTGEAAFVPRPVGQMDIPANRLVVVDEASMVGPDVWQDLRDGVSQADCSLMLVGDPFQLPPVQAYGEKPFSVLTDDFECDYRVDLTEILRQALESPIVRASMLLREGKVAEAWKLLPRAQKFMPTALSYLDGSGMVICHTNKARYLINYKIREAKGLPQKEVQKNEPLLCRRNVYEVPAFNGEVLAFPGWEEVYQGSHEVGWKEKRSTRFGRMTLNNRETLMALDGLSGQLDPIPAVAIARKARELAKRPMPFLQAHYGYALTCHSAQGSEADKVLIAMEPTIRLSEPDGKRWAYTAITRAKQEVSLYWS